MPFNCVTLEMFQGLVTNKDDSVSFWETKFEKRLYLIKSFTKISEYVKIVLMT
jgi:hypothetical protein